jgi:hypothetical protein
MSISSTGLYGSATIVNSDLFTDVETLKETVTTLNTTYLQTTEEHRTDISQNRQDISLNCYIYVCACVYIYIHIYMYTHTHTHTHI